MDHTVMHGRLVSVQSWARMCEFATWLGQARPVLAVDTETSGLDWWRGELRTVQVGDARTGWAFLWPEWSGPLQDLLSRYTGRIAMHNAAFDMHWLHRAGVHIPWDRIDDTGVLAHAFPGVLPRALKPLSAQLVDPRAAAAQVLLDRVRRERGWTWGTIPRRLGIYQAYGAMDTMLTARVWEALQTAEHSPVYQLEMAVERALWKMEEHGLPVDIDYISRVRERYACELEDIDAAVAATGAPANSPLRLGEWLVQRGAKLPRTVTGAAWSTDEAALRDAAASPDLAEEARDVIRLVRTKRDTERVDRTYLKGLLESETGGVVHPSIDALGARTARMSVKRPPLQQLPAGSSVVRDAVVAPEGMRLVAIDYDQMELRLLAHFACEQTMRDAFRSGDNLHWRMAKVLYGPDAGKTEYKRTKSGSYGKIYGIRAPRFAAQQDVPLEEAREFLDSYDRHFPGIARFIQNVTAEAQRRYSRDGTAWVRTPLGRVHRAPTTKQGKPEYYKLINYLIQGTAADAFKQAVVDLDSAGFGEFMRLPVHDEMLFAFPEESALELTEEAALIMSDCSTFAVPLTVQGSEPMGRWGDAYDLCLTGQHDECHREFCTCEECGHDLP